VRRARRGREHVVGTISRRAFQHRIAAVLAMVLLPSAAAGAAAADEAAAALPALGIDEAAISVSGISSGGFMAHQFHVAHSARLMGAGIIAGGPYACAGGGYPFNIFRALSVCSEIAAATFRGPPDPQRSIAAVRAAEQAGAIDATAGLGGDRVFLFSGKQDDVVPASVVETVGTVYRAFDQASAIRMVADVKAPHAMLTTSFGNACDTFETPFINNCGFDLAGAVLGQIYGPLLPKAAADGEFRSFAQGAFVDARVRHGMAAQGWLYIPRSCTGGGCRLHVALHGCQQSEEMIGDAFIRHAGYNEWAESNRIVVLYPQAAVLERRVLGVALPWPNPQGCWDWWGFTGPDYARRAGPQIAAINAMIDRLVQPVAR